MSKPVKRLRQLDFLRGVAILLVMLRHQELVEFTSKMGWIGVDLFFVLSGFLVSGLLFKEYITYGNIRPSRFLIRRGFKIYPIYYLFYPVYFIYASSSKPINMNAVLPDLLFVQNYIYGWGYANESSWSLAVEEHFYIGFSLLLWLGLTKLRIRPNDKPGKWGMNTTELIIVATLLTCLFLRIITNLFFTSTLLDLARNFTMTHLRIDSLLAGVLVSYLYTFRREPLKRLIIKYENLCLLTIPLLLSFTPFVSPVYSFFVKTLGFTFLYLAFSLLLLIFLLDESINDKLNRFFTKPVVTLVSKIGVASYSIYITHVFINDVIRSLDIPNKFVLFFVSAAVSIVVGILLTTYVENYFLAIRDKYYPARSS